MNGRRKLIFNGKFFLGGGAWKFLFPLANQENNPMLIHTNDFCGKNGPKLPKKIPSKITIFTKNKVQISNIIFLTFLSEFGYQIWLIPLVCVTSQK
jgi:hypothetical protein